MLRGPVPISRRRTPSLRRSAREDHRHNYLNSIESAAGLRTARAGRRRPTQRILAEGDLSDRAQSDLQSPPSGQWRRRVHPAAVVDQRKPQRLACHDHEWVFSTDTWRVVRSHVGRLAGKRPCRRPLRRSVGQVYSTAYSSRGESQSTCRDRDAQPLRSTRPPGSSRPRRHQAGDPLREPESGWWVGPRALTLSTTEGRRCVEP
jgi:hypothetical protein